MPISQMTPDDIREAYVLYIGAGAVAAGGIISMVRSLPLIWHGMKSGFADLRSMHGSVSETGADRSGFVDEVRHRRRRSRSSLVIMIAPQLHLQWNLFGALLIVVIGFLFTTVSSHLTGEIGSSSCPTSGMTVATLLLTCLVFLIVGWTGPHYFVTALSIGGIVCIASSNGGTTSQDLKTGFLVGSTPRLQQIAILAGIARLRPRARSDPARAEQRLHRLRSADDLPKDRSRRERRRGCRPRISRRFRSS